MNDLITIWKTPDSNFTEDEWLFYYWYKHLKHAPQKYIYRPAACDSLPKRLQYVTTMPLCAACMFADTSRRTWKTSKFYILIYL